jgi:hypothetical protein
MSSENCFRTWATWVLGVRGTWNGFLLGQAAWIFATLGVWREGEGEGEGEREREEKRYTGT